MPTIIDKVASAGTSLGTSTADIQIGGASQYTPEWAERLLGLSVSAICITPTTQEATHGTAWISSNSFAPNPSTILWTGVNGSVATNSLPTSPEVQFYAMHYKIHGGEPYDVYGKAAVANTAAPYLSAAITFGTDDCLMPSALDAYPTAVEVYYDVSSKTGTASASASQALTSFTITGTKSVTEQFGYVLKTATAAAKGIIGYFRATSNGFETSPIDMMVEPANSTLGTVTGEFTPKVARKPCLVGTAPTSVISPTFYQGGGTAVTTDITNYGVAFVRDWGRA